MTTKSRHASKGMSVSGDPVDTGKRVTKAQTPRAKVRPPYFGLERKGASLGEASNTSIPGPALTNFRGAGSGLAMSMAKQGKNTGASSQGK